MSLERRITVDPTKMGGVPCIRGLRIPVATVLAMLGQGMSEAEIAGLRVEGVL